jgi:hypothetical protein
MDSFPNEILQKIYKYNFDDVRTLHSCLLVNKLWCNNVVPILWNRPFHLLLLIYNKKYNKKSYEIISTYLSCLDKEKMSKLTLTTASKLTQNNKPCYNYPSFLLHLSYYTFIVSIQEWCAVYENYSSTKIIQSLFRLFANFSPGLITLEFATSEIDFDNFNTINSTLSLCDSIVQNWMSNVSELELAGNFVIDHNFPSLFKKCKNIKKVSIL